ncbi:MAG: MBL fold metallo-hydrolase [Erysipelotrichales bacterium]|nr:MAG: MBL fold metallo-hydrolase [Erysipelotrichales bacterium]
MIEQLAENIFARRINIPEGNWPLITYLWVTTRYNLYLDAGLGEEAIIELSKFADPTKPDICIYSHSHFDHIWGAGVLEHPEIIAHVNFMKHYHGIEQDRIKYKPLAEGNNEVLLPTRLISTDTDLDDEILLLTAPGHTDDGLIVYNKKRHILFLGDVAADEGKDLPEISGSCSTYLSTLKKLRDLDIEFILCSHRNPEKKTYLNTLIENAYILLKNCQ